jgi:hypothetical protein
MCARADVPAVDAWLAANRHLFTHQGRPLAAAAAGSSGGGGGGAHHALCANGACAAAPAAAADGAGTGSSSGSSSPERGAAGGGGGDDGGHPEALHGPIISSCFMLGPSARARLAADTGVQLWELEQFMDEGVFVPAGVPHQVRNLASCTKVRARAGAAPLGALCWRRACGVGREAHAGRPAVRRRAAVPCRSVPWRTHPSRLLRPAPHPAQQHTARHKQTHTHTHTSAARRRRRHHHRARRSPSTL